jgi:hypothetical protein
MCMTNIKVKPRIGKTKAYNLTLEEGVVNAVKKIDLGQSFSLYITNLIKKDIEQRTTRKSIKEIFGAGFQPITFTTKEEEIEYYKMIGLSDYSV